jgi:hypothetical protein
VAFQVLGKPVQGRAEDLRLCSNWTSRSMRQRPRRAQREAGGDTEAIRMTGPALAVGGRSKLRPGGSGACQMQGRGSGPTGRRGTSVWEQTTLGGRRSGRITHAAAAQCKCTTAA